MSRPVEPTRESSPWSPKRTNLGVSAASDNAALTVSLPAPPLRDAPSLLRSAATLSVSSSLSPKNVTLAVVSRTRLSSPLPPKNEDVPLNPLSTVIVSSPPLPLAVEEPCLPVIVKTSFAAPSLKTALSELSLMSIVS